MGTAYCLGGEVEPERPDDKVLVKHVAQSRSTGAGVKSSQGNVWCWKCKGSYNFKNMEFQFCPRCASTLMSQEEYERRKQFGTTDVEEPIDLPSPGPPGLKSQDEKSSHKEDINKLKIALPTSAQSESNTKMDRMGTDSLDHYNSIFSPTGEREESYADYIGIQDISAESINAMVLQCKKLQEQNERVMTQRESQTLVKEALNLSHKLLLQTQSQEETVYTPPVDDRIRLGSKASVREMRLMYQEMKRMSQDDVISNDDPNMPGASKKPETIDEHGKVFLDLLDKAENAQTSRIPGKTTPPAPPNRLPGKDDVSWRNEESLHNLEIAPDEQDWSTPEPRVRGSAFEEDRDLSSHSLKDAEIIEFEDYSTPAVPRSRGNVKLHRELETPEVPDLDMPNGGPPSGKPNLDKAPV